MKVDKHNILHWLILILSTVNIFVAIPFRIFKSKHKKRVVFYNQMHGNSKSLADYIAQKDKSIEMYFLSFPEYLGVYKNHHNLPSLNMLNLLDMIKVAQSDVVVTNYVALTLVYMAKFTNIKFIDVWHGLPMLKNQTPKIMSYLNSYSEVWLSSESMKKFYKERYKLHTKLVVTGYGRTDKLFNNAYDQSSVKKKYGLPQDRKIILIAPTWQHNNPNRKELPFGLTQTELLSNLDDFAIKTNYFFVFRAHLQSSDIKAVGKNIKAISVHDFPDTEELISAADLLVTDWSSIAFDYMATKRPIIFIESPAPFVEDELESRCTPGNRFGRVIVNFDEFKRTAARYLDNNKLYQKENKTEIERIEAIAYGGTLDGRSTERYYRRLRKLLY